MENRLMSDLPSMPVTWGEEASKARLIVIARSMAEQKGVDPALVCGLCEVESAWEPWAVRHERGYRWILFDDVALGDVSPGDVPEFNYRGGINAHLRIRKEAMDLKPAAMSIVTELIGERTSWGLMQVMGAVARERGLKGWLTCMLQPEVNLSIGIKHLQWLTERWSEPAGKDKNGVDRYLVLDTDIISAYNQGSSRRQGFRRGALEGISPLQPWRESPGEYVNQAYVDKVLAAMRRYQT